ncbi:hypothetical protein [Microbulbifer taiwanensis]|uniref:Pentapeptide MXKDX repeat protein n=1 Tax=Microbulbifer taiwanensis TaxID=986746 RepID=A0ABW1YNV0_9GAMM|nr:hypothetical protein [Microbulbifer taiwanensis]
MKSLTAPILLAALFTATATQAHDPSLHKNKGEKPKCEAMENMDHSKMDPNDPVMQAMMKKCMDQLHEESDSAGHHGDSHQPEK